MGKQNIIKIDNQNDYKKIEAILKKSKSESILLVCDASVKHLNINKYFEDLEKKFNIIRFSDFQSNPLYCSVVNGVNVFLENHCDTIIAVGGGSAIDVAKCIKLFSNMDHSKNYLKQTIIPNSNIFFISMPTTAGTGSEATRYAVIYYNDEKQSVSDYSCIPQAVIIDPSVLKTLPEYQKISTMFDALCHAIEAYWSVNSNNESEEYSKAAIHIILENYNMYFQNDSSACLNMLIASNKAGKAINIAQTTAGHAMCYKLTGIYGISHGHAAALCVRKIWPYMIEHIDECTDKRGKEHLERVFIDLAKAFGVTDIMDAASKFNELFLSFNLKKVEMRGNYDIEILKNSVNSVRLKNNPIYLNADAIERLYWQILK